MLTQLTFGKDKDSVNQGSGILPNIGGGNANNTR